jgi:hypothetical protein
VAANLNFSRFERKEFIATDDKVVALSHYAAATADQEELQLGLRDGVHTAEREG